MMSSLKAIGARDGGALANPWKCTMPKASPKSVLVRMPARIAPRERRTSSTAVTMIPAPDIQTDG